MIKPARRENARNKTVPKSVRRSGDGSATDTSTPTKNSRRAPAPAPSPRRTPSRSSRHPRTSNEHPTPYHIPAPSSHRIPASSPRHIPAPSPRRTIAAPKPSRTPSPNPSPKPSRAPSPNPSPTPSRTAPSPPPISPRHVKNTKEKARWRRSLRSNSSLTAPLKPSTPEQTKAKKIKNRAASPPRSENTPTLVRRVSGFSLLRRMSNTPLMRCNSTQIDPGPTTTDTPIKRHVSGSGAVAVETPSAVNGATPIINNSPHAVGQQPFTGTAQDMDTNETPIVKSGTRFVKGTVRRQGSERFIAVKKLLQGGNEQKNHTFPRLDPVAAQPAPKPVLRGYDVKPVNRSPRTTKRTKKQVWAQRAGQSAGGSTNRAPRNPSKLAAAVDLDRPSEDASSVTHHSQERHNPSGSASDVLHLNNDQVSHVADPASGFPALAPPPVSSTVEVTVDCFDDIDNLPPLEERFDFTRATSSPRIRELRLKLGRKEAAFADHLKLLDTHLTDAKGKLGSMTTRTEPPATPPRLLLPQLTSLDSESDSNSDSDSDLAIPETPTAAPVFGPVAMFSVPTLTLGRAKTFIREETDAGAAEIDYAEDARQIVERLRAQQPV